MDLRGIAVLRIGLGILILADLINRSRDFTAFYTDDGVLPRADWIRRTNDWHWSLHASVGNDWLVGALFVFAAVLAVMLILGYRSRIAAVLSFVLMCSLHSRNFMVLQGGDTAFRMLVFWSMFLPLGARWSVEAAARDEEPRSNDFHSMATVGILLLVVSVYLGAIAHKLGQPGVVEVRQGAALRSQHPAVHDPAGPVDGVAGLAHHYHDLRDPGGCRAPGQRYCSCRECPSGLASRCR